MLHYVRQFSKQDHFPSICSTVYPNLERFQICISNKASNHGSSAAALSSSPPTTLNSGFESMKISSPKMNNRNLIHLDGRSGNRSASPPPQHHQQQQQLPPQSTSTLAGATSNSKWNCLSKNIYPSTFFTQAWNAKNCAFKARPRPKRQAPFSYLFINHVHRKWQILEILWEDTNIIHARVFGNSCFESHSPWSKVNSLGIVLSPQP